jgi:hypothetical protein
LDLDDPPHTRLWRKNSRLPAKLTSDQLSPMKFLESFWESMRIELANCQRQRAGKDQRHHSEAENLSVHGSFWESLGGFHRVESSTGI